MEDIQQQVKEIKTQLRLSMNGAVSASMRQKGLLYKLNFGVELPRLNQIAQGYAPNHALAAALWKEDIRECKILAALLQPIDSFCPEIADIWVSDIRTVEIAELTSMNLFSRLPYAPSKAMQWIASEDEFQQVCGYCMIARLLRQKGDMPERVQNEFLDQALTTFLSSDARLQSAILAALRRFMHHSQEQAFALCRRIESLATGNSEAACMLRCFVKDELDESV